MPDVQRTLAAWSYRLLVMALLAGLLLLIVAFLVSLARDVLDASWRDICLSTVIGLVAVYVTSWLLDKERKDD